MNNPLVSICIPAYNCAEYIGPCLQSIVNQSYHNIEIIIVNDGSTDNSSAVIQTWCNTDARIRLIKQENKGAAAARNIAFRESRGALIKFIDGDDLINPEMIQDQVNLVDSDDHIISGKWGRFYGNDLSTFKLSTEACWQTLTPINWILSAWERGEPMTQPGIFLIPRKLIDKSGLWNEELNLLDDTEFFNRLMLNARLIVFCSTSVLYYRSGVGGLSGQVSRNHLLSAYAALDGVTTLLYNSDKSQNVEKLCANIWQTFVFNYYPAQLDLIEKAEQKINAFGGSSLKISLGGYSKFLANLIGWKTVKKLKHR